MVVDDDDRTCASFAGDIPHPPLPLQGMVQAFLDGAVEVAAAAVVHRDDDTSCVVAAMVVVGRRETLGVVNMNQHCQHYSCYAVAAVADRPSPSIRPRPGCCGCPPQPHYSFEDGEQSYLRQHSHLPPPPALLEELAHQQHCQCLPTSPLYKRMMRMWM